MLLPFGGGGREHVALCFVLTAQAAAVARASGRPGAHALHRRVRKRLSSPRRREEKGNLERLAGTTPQEAGKSASEGLNRLSGGTSPASRRSPLFVPHTERPGRMRGASAELRAARGAWRPRRHPGPRPGRAAQGRPSSESTPPFKLQTMRRDCWRR